MIDSRRVRIRTSLPMLALFLSGCARERDVAVVEPILAKPYLGQPAALAAAPPAAPGVVGIQPVAGQRALGMPVYQSQPVAALPPAQAIAPPPASSTAASDPGQPYYVPSPAMPLVGAPAPAGALVSAPASPAIAGVPQAVGVLPAAPTGMWTSTQGNRPLALHQFPTTTTGSSFTPSVPVDGATASNMQANSGVIPATAAVPFVSGIQSNTPPPIDTRRVFMSDTGEHMQASRIIGQPVTPAPAPPPQPLAGPPIPNPTLATPLPEAAASLPRNPPAAVRLDEPVAPKPRNISMPVPSLDDDTAKTPPKKIESPGDAPSAEPPRTARKSPPADGPKRNEPPRSNAERPNAKTLDADPPDPPRPKKSAAPPLKKSSDDGAGVEIPPDDLGAPPKPKGLGS